MKKLIVIMIVLFAASTAFAQITGSKHDFSAETWNNAGSGEICIVCHTPHNADVTVTSSPLWNHEVTATAAFTVYSVTNSPTMDAATGQPDGASKLCLSCHDGTIGVDNFGGSGTNADKITGVALLGTDLSNDHPVSFTYDDALATTDGGLHPPSTTVSGLAGGGHIDDDLLFANKLECASCHNVHDGGSVHFLKIENATSVLCLTCHNK